MCHGVGAIGAASTDRNRPAAPRVYTMMPAPPRQTSRQDTDYRALLESVRAIVWRADARTFQTTFTSKEAEEVLGYALDSWLTVPGFWVSHLHPDDRERVLDYTARHTAQGRAHDFEYRMVAADGRTVWLRNIVNVIVRNGVPDELVGVTIDISERRRAEIEVDQLRQELTAVARAATLGELAATLAHELSQPLGAILSNAETGHLLLRRGDAAAGQQLNAILADIREDARRAGDVIHRVDMLFRRRPVDYHRLDVAALVDAVLLTVRSMLSVRGIATVVDVPSGLPAIRGDAVQIQQVLVNVMRNAIEAMAAGRATDRRLVIRAARRDGCVEVAVTDSGAGIAEHILPRMFEPFATTKPGGMGMGLAISRRIVAAHGGRIAAENSTPAGATIRFTIPVYDAE